MKKQDALYCAIALGALIAAYFTGKGCSPAPTSEKPTVTSGPVRIMRDTILKQVIVENRIYIPVAEPRLNTTERAVLDTVVRRDSAEATLHIEFNKEEEQFENIIAAFTVPVQTKELTNYVDREIRIEIPVPGTSPADTDDWQWFGIGGGAGVALSIIAFLLFMR